MSARRSLSRDVRLYLEDVVTCCEKILRFTRGMTRDEIIADDKTYDAVQRNLFVLGEAVKCVPDEIRQRHPEVAWRKIAGLRDFLAHVYFAIETISFAT
ncbi:MAG TPA: HepT-like ribonuclease domain-containing protein [Polyangiaceae bacterium]|nr:HepT-like ribonuclease domain-containing protein [Polyangiaceae bacterium]